MTLPTLGSLRDEVLQRAGMGSKRKKLATNWVNASLREISEAHDWPELLDVATFNTVANYATGTVSLANGATTITGVGTTFPSGCANRKFSAGWGKPFFNIASYTNATTIDLTDNWPFTALSGDTYQIYEDVYTLAGGIQKVFRD